MVRERAFVTDMDFCSHSMLQQTLSPSPFHLYFHPSPTSVPPPSAAAFPHHPRPQTAASQAPYFRSTQVEREEGRKMETAALKNGFRPEAAAAPPPLADEVVWGVERGNSLVDDFVDDLLNLQGLEPEEEEEERDGDCDGDETLDGAFELETSNSSAASVDHPPVSDISLLPAHDEAELEWVSRIIDDTMAEFPPCAQTPAAVTLSQPLPPAPAGNRKVRSKRARVTGRAWPAAPFATDSSATVTAGDSSSSSCTSPSSYSSCLIYTHSAFRPTSPLLPVARPKKRGRKPKHPVAGGAGDRRCTHCGTQKTPQWRAGPEGSKTLCNACGVRFKSGRLLPEYRPACSPTFVSHVHSNSHRKVLEMRRNKTDPVPTF